MMLVLLGCSHGNCAQETSYPLDMLRNYATQAICEGCYDEAQFGGTPWSELPAILPTDLTFYWPDTLPPAFKELLTKLVDMRALAEELVGHDDHAVCDLVDMLVTK